MTRRGIRRAALTRRRIEALLTVVREWQAGADEQSIVDTGLAATWAEAERLFKDVDAAAGALLDRLNDRST